MINKESLLEVKCYEDVNHEKFLYEGTLLAISKKYAYVVNPSSNKVEEHFYDRLETKF